MSLTCSTCHYVQCLVLSVVRPRKSNHGTRVVANDHNLASGREKLLIENSTQELGRETRTVHDDIGLLTRVVCVRGVGDVLENGSLEDCAVFGALAD